MLFQDDDEETWKLVASSSASSSRHHGDDNTAALGKRLSSLAKRLEEDHQSSSATSYWNDLVSQVQSNGFRYSTQAMKPLATVAAAAAAAAAAADGGDANSSSSLPPVAFESEGGQAHLKATETLLKLSKDRAIQVTLSALRSIDTETDSKFQSLLGSRELLWKTCVHHNRQRLARLGVLTECLRLEQDADANADADAGTGTGAGAAAQTIPSILDSLDSLYQTSNGGGDQYRGLFRLLVTIATGPHTATPSRQQLEPAQALRANTSLLLSSSSFQEPTSTFASFQAEVVQELQAQQLRERTEAMEALLVLLYERINGGIRRADYALLLLAWKQSGDFYTQGSYYSSTEPRLAQLAGLICAEATALWRGLAVSDSNNTNTNIDNDTPWAPRHPLMLEITASGHPQVAQKEINTLTTILVEYVQEAQKRSPSNSGMITTTRQDEFPESLALLSFGLLLRLAHDSFQSCNDAPQGVWSSFAIKGMEMAQMANDQCGAFDYLFLVVDCLTQSTSTTQQSAPAPDHLYDWQCSDVANHPLLLEQEATRKTNDAAPDTTAYTSIAREVLAASVASFANGSTGEGILAIDQSNSTDNLGMLCKLGAKIFQNNPLLCEQFWLDWETYISHSHHHRSGGSYPLCQLLDASHRLAVAALEAVRQHQVPNEFLVQATAPFLQFLASLSHTPEIVETTVAVLPEGLLRQALLCCQLPLTTATSSEYAASRLVLLEAVSRLAQFGNSKSCVECLRRSLEEESSANSNSTVMVDGPHVLTRLMAQGHTPSQEDQVVAQSVLAIMAHLLDGAPQRWALQLAREFIDSNDSQVSLAKFLAPGHATVHPAGLVLAELIEHLTSVVFCDTFQAHDAITFLRCITASLLAASTTLASSLSAATTSTNNAVFSFETAQTILQSLSNFLKLIRTVIELHQSALVRETALELRDAVINTLASSTGLGQAIIYYATAPVSLTLAIKLQGAMEDQSILQQVAAGGEYDGDKAKQYGAWQSVLVQPSMSHNNPMEYLAKHVLVDSVNKLTAEELDLEGLVARNWTGVPDNKMAPLETAWSAIRLLSLWASHVEDILATHVEDLGEIPMPLEGAAKELMETKSPYRLLSRLATAPMPCRINSGMMSVWESAGLSNFELLLPYLGGAMEESTLLLQNVPCSTTLDLVHACLGHVRSICLEETVADSLLFRAVFRSSRFSLLLGQSIDQALEIGKKQGDLDQRGKEVLRNGLLSLRVIASCVEVNPTVADCILYPQDKSIIPKLIQAATAAGKSFDPNSSETPLFETDTDIVKLRLATGSMAVLSSLWQCVRTLPLSQNDSATSRLIAAVDGQAAFVTSLVGTVASFALSKDLESRLAPTTAADYAQGALGNYMALALELMGTEVAYTSTTNGKQSNVALENFLLRDFVPTKRMCSFVGYEMTAAASSDLCNATGSRANLPLGLLSCFPATSKSRLQSDFYTSENSFDVSSAVHWVSGNTGGEDGSLNETVAKVAVSYQLTTSDLRVAAAWRRFSEMSTLLSVHTGKEGMPTSRVFEMAHVTLAALDENLKMISKIQLDVGDFMLFESKRMVQCLTGLVMFFFEVFSHRSIPTDWSIVDDLTSSLIMLSTCSDTILSMSLSSRGTASDLIQSHPSVVLGKTIITCYMVVLGILPSSEELRDESIQDRVNESFKVACRVNSQLLLRICTLLKSEANGPVEEDLRESLLASISLFTALFSTKSGVRLDDAACLKTASAILKEYNVIEEILTVAIRYSGDISKLVSDSSMETVPKEAQEKIPIVESTFDLLFAIAEASSPDLLSTLPSTKVAQILVRNPLFGLTRSEEIYTLPRGYQISKSNSPHSQSRFRVGEDDPLHILWTTSMKVLAASLRSASDSPAGKGFLDMSLEFLQVYRSSLLYSLKSCGSRLTRNGLHETTAILSLVAEMCRRNSRELFLRGCQGMCDEFVLWSRFVVATLSKFLGASGTARELFFSIQEFESADAGFEHGSVPSFQPRHPLLADGIPSAKHEAVKFAHFASRCYQRVTTVDFETSTATSFRLAALAKNRDSDTDLERSSRLSVTNEFAVQMERAAASSVAQAVSILWRMYPASFCFHVISVTEAAQLNIMTVVQPGMIIGYYPFDGESLLSKNDSGKDMRFGKVISSDTVNRCWRIVPLRKVALEKASNDPDEPQIVRAGQLGGFEDPTGRKPISSFSPAPNPMTEMENGKNVLDLGHLILLLRWCHQETLFMQNGALDRCSNIEPSIRRLAEQVTALLGAELSIHDEAGSRLNISAKDGAKLDAQVFELFAARSILENCDNIENSGPISLAQEGRLKEVIESASWAAVRPQIEEEIRRFWKEKQEKEQRRKDKRSLSSDAAWFSGMRRKGYSQKSAFRGFR